MTATKKNLKGTKKFEKKHLKGVLERRKATAKVKQQVLNKSKKKAKRSQDDDFYKGPAKENGGEPKPNGQKPGAKASEMSVDDFFKGGFEILDKKPSKTSAGKLGKRKTQPASVRCRSVKRRQRSRSIRRSGGSPLTVAMWRLPATMTRRTGL